MQLLETRSKQIYFVVASKFLAAQRGPSPLDPSEAETVSRMKTRSEHLQAESGLSELRCQVQETEVSHARPRAAPIDYGVDAARARGPTFFHAAPVVGGARAL